MRPFNIQTLIHCGDTLLKICRTEYVEENEMGSGQDDREKFEARTLQVP